MIGALVVLMQSFGLAVMSFVGVGMLLQNFLSAGASMAGLRGLRSAIAHSDGIFLGIAGLFWVISQVLMVRMLIKNRGVPDFNSPNGNMQWDIVFVPVIYLIFLGFGLFLLSIIGFIVAGVFHIVMEEQISILIGAVPMVGIVGWIGYYFWRTRNDPAPSDEGYVEWMRAKKAERKGRDA